MRILIDIGHPAHVHLFKHFAWEMQKNGHTFFFTCREKEFEIFLLKKYGFEYKSFGRKYISKLSKIWGMLEFGLKEILVSLKFKPDILLSHGSIYAAHAAFILRKPHISLEDTGNWEQVRLYKPFTHDILTSNVFPFNYGNKQIRYNGHHELAYLNPKYYSPNSNILRTLKVLTNEKYAILRFVSWKASHDIGQKGLSNLVKEKIINLLTTYNIKVFISSEDKLPSKFEKYKINIPPDAIHDALSFAEFFIGEGTTMAMEAGILGTPSIYVNSLQYMNIKDMEGYGLIFNFQDSIGVLEKINDLLGMPNLKETWQIRQKKMFNEKINVTTFMVWFIENYPDSVKIMKENPAYQLKFK